MTDVAFDEYYVSSSESRLIPFPRRSGTSLSDYRGLINWDIGVLDKIKEAVESSIYSVMIRDALMANTRISDPFGALYICDLMPDRINREDYLLLSHLATKIHDLSDDLIFNDGMDD